MTRLSCSALVSLAAVGCFGNDQIQIGVGEPFRVHTSDKYPAAQFRKGPLPGTPYPKTMGMGTPAPTPAGDAGTKPAGPPQIVDFSTPALAYQGQGSIGLTGHTSENASSVAFALEGIGTGYWVVPIVSEVDPNNDRPFDAFADFDDSIPSEYRRLIAVAIDENNVAGQQDARLICIASAVPNNFNTCVRENGKEPPPPQAVISLSWEENADLDLQILTPDGRLIAPKDSTTGVAGIDAGAIGTIDRDSNAACVMDSIRREDMVWKTDMPHGTYGVYVNMFDSCKQPAVHFRVEIYSKVDQDDGGAHLQLFYPRPEDPPGGILLDISANGGTARGLFVTEFNFR